MTDKITLKAEWIDSFQLRPLKSVTGDPLPVAFCAVRGCRKRGRVWIFWSPPDREPMQRQQEKSTVCIEHACGYANDVLDTFKFAGQHGNVSLPGVTDK